MPPLTFTIIDAQAPGITVACTDMAITVTANFIVDFPLNRGQIKKTLRDKYNTQVVINNVNASIQALIGTQI